MEEKIVQIRLLVPVNTSYTRMSLQNLVRFWYLEHRDDDLGPVGLDGDGA